jgi:hypothetical protein
MKRSSVIGRRIRLVSAPDLAIAPYTPAETIDVPDVIGLENSRLVWAPTIEEGFCSHFTQPSSGLLGQFCRLHRRGESEIYNFARKWGMLGEDICTEYGHDHGWYDSPDENWEPIALWRDVSRKFDAVLQIGHALNCGLLPGDELWSRIAPKYARERLRSSVDLESRRRRDWTTLQELIHYDFVTVAGLYPMLVPAAHNDSDSRFFPPKVLLAGKSGGPFAALVVQLMYTLCASSAVPQCSGCGSWYAAFRAPRKGQRQYCQRCRESKVPERDAMRDYRARRARKTIR